MNPQLKLAGLSVMALAIAAACGAKKDAPAPAAASAPAAVSPASPSGAAPAAPAGPAADYTALLAAPDRPPADAARDANRKPVQVLAFAKILPGETVFEEEAGAGYFTELLSHAVGPNGHVVMQAPPEFTGYYKTETDARLAGARLPNVKVSASHFDKLDAADNSADVVTWLQGPHELWFHPKAGAGGVDNYGDPAKSFAEAYRITKPGGYFVVIDHVAAAGSPPEKSGNDLHRIDPAVIKKMAEGAGFRLDEASNLLAAPTDDHTKSVFDASVKGNTDQVLLRYRKPA